MNKLEIIAQIGDIKEIEYRNTLALTSIIELLLEKILSAGKTYPGKRKS